MDGPSTSTDRILTRLERGETIRFASCLMGPFLRSLDGEAPGRRLVLDISVENGMAVIKPREMS